MTKCETRNLVNKTESVENLAKQLIGKFPDISDMKSARRRAQVMINPQIPSDLKDD
jgi:hypothetical protein